MSRSVASSVRVPEPTIMYSSSNQLPAAFTIVPPTWPRDNPSWWAIVRWLAIVSYEAATRTTLAARDSTEGLGVGLDSICLLVDRRAICVTIETLTLFKVGCPHLGVYFSTTRRFHLQLH